MLKNLKHLGAAFVACAALWACSDDKYEPDPIPTPGNTEEYLSVESVTPDQVEATGGEVTITVKSHRVATGKAADEWVKRSTSERNDDVMTFVYTVSANEGIERTTTITFSCGELTADATISQKGAIIGPGPTPPVIQEAANSVEMAKLMSLGWNLGNQFDSHNNGVASETAWGNAATTQALFMQLAQSGIKAVRIPVTWLGKFGSAPDYKIDEAWLNRIAEVVGYAENAGLYAIINMHHDGANSAYWLDIKGAATDASKQAAIKEQITAMWGQIAARFADKGHFLMFEAFNEIHDGGWGWGDNRKDGGKQYAALNEWNQTFVDAVRAAGGYNATRFLGIPGYVTNPALTMDHLVLPNDPAGADRLLVAVHFYDPTQFAIEATATEWGHTGNPANTAGWGDEANVTDTFDKLANKYISAGHGVYVGECGATTRSTERDEAFRLYYIEYVFKAAADRGLAMFFWDNGSAATGKEAFGLFNHTTGRFISSKAEAAVATMVKAFTTDDPAYTLQSVYDNAPQ